MGFDSAGIKATGHSDETLKPKPPWHGGHLS